MYKKKLKYTRITPNYRKSQPTVLILLEKLFFVTFLCTEIMWNYKLWIIFSHSFLHLVESSLQLLSPQYEIRFVEIEQRSSPFPRRGSSFLLPFPFSPKLKQRAVLFSAFNCLLVWPWICRTLGVMRLYKNLSSHSCGLWLWELWELKTASQSDSIAVQWISTFIPSMWRLLGILWPLRGLGWVLVRHYRVVAFLDSKPQRMSFPLTVASLPEC